MPSAERQNPPAASSGPASVRHIWVYLMSSCLSGKPSTAGAPLIPEPVPVGFFSFHQNNGKKMQNEASFSPIFAYPTKAIVDLLMSKENLKAA